jgi:hypothetical protein
VRKGIGREPGKSERASEGNVSPNLGKKRRRGSAPDYCLVCGRGDKVAGSP